MSIAHWRAASPHYLVVAVALAVVAVLAISFARADAADGDTTTLANGAAAVTLTPSQSANLTTTAEIAGAVTDSGTLTITAGSLFSANSGITLATQSWTGACAACPSGGPVAFFPSGFVGLATARADNTTSATQPGVNTPATLNIVGPPVFTFVAVPTGAAPAATAPSTSIGNLSCGNDCNSRVDIYASIKDANGTVYPNGVNVSLTINNFSVGAFNNGTGFTVAQATANLDATNDTVANPVNGVAAFLLANNEEFTASQTGVGTTTITATIAEGTGTFELLVTGPPASLQVDFFSVTNADAGVDNVVDSVNFGTAAPFALGQNQSAIAVGADTLGNDLLGTRVTALDAAGNVVNVVATAPGQPPLVTDATGDAVPISFAAGLGIPAANFGVAGPNANTGAASGGVAYAVGDSSATVAQGDRTIRAAFTTAGGTALTGTATIRQGGAPANIDIDVEIQGAQAPTLASDQIGIFTATVTSSDEGIVGDGTVVTFQPPATAQFLGFGLGAAANVPTSNGVATARLLPTGVEQTITVIVTSGAASEVQQVVMSSQSGDPIAAASVEVTAADTELAIGEATTVTAEVVRNDGSPAALATGLWREATATAAVPSGVVTTNRDGIATTTFTADVPGSRAVSFTVVNIVSGVVVETAVSGSVTISVGGSAGTSGLTSLTSFSAWIGGADTTASELFAALRAEASVGILWKWTGSAWISFALIGTTELPGSDNFTVTLGDILFIGQST